MGRGTAKPAAGFSSHSALTDTQADELRLAALRDAGFEVVEITEATVWHRPDEVGRLVEDARRACRLR